MTLPLCQMGITKPTTVNENVSTFVTNVGCHSHFWELEYLKHFTKCNPEQVLII